MRLGSFALGSVMASANFMYHIIAISIWVLFAPLEWTWTHALR